MSKRKLLLADDSVTIQKVVNLTFADEGIEVISVSDGDAAIEKVFEVSPDLIMADVNMPGINGYEICERIRRDENLSKTPVILLVGSFEPFDENEAQRVGADDFLTKPFQSIRQLVNKVTGLLDSAKYPDVESTEDSADSEDTLAMTANEDQTVYQYGDTGLDDEMIQTNHPTSFSFDETQRFEQKDASKLEESPKSEEDDENILQAGDDLVESESKLAESEQSASNNSDFASADFDESEKITEEVDEVKSVTYEIHEESTEPVETQQRGFLIKSEDGATKEIEEMKLVSDPSEETIVEQAEESEGQADLEPTAAGSEAEEPISQVVADEPILIEAEESENEGDATVLEPADTLASGQKEDDVLGDRTVPMETEELISGEQKVSDEVGGDQAVVDENEPGDEEMSSRDDSEVTSDRGWELKEDESKTLQIANIEEEIPLPELPTVLETDDDDILQLPPMDPENDAIVATASKDSANSGVSLASEHSGISADSAQITPELIEVIVAKVIDRLSDNAVKEVAWEVVPQMTELIVTKMAEEKLK